LSPFRRRRTSIRWQGGSSASPPQERLVAVYCHVAHHRATVVRKPSVHCVDSVGSLGQHPYRPANAHSSHMPSLHPISLWNTFQNAQLTEGCPILKATPATRPCSTTHATQNEPSRRRLRRHQQRFRLTQAKPALRRRTASSRQLVLPQVIRRWLPPALLCPLSTGLYRTFAPSGQVDLP